MSDSNNTNSSPNIDSDKFSIIVIKPNKFDFNILSSTSFRKKNMNYPDLDINNPEHSFKLKHNFIDFIKFKKYIKDYIIIDDNITKTNMMEKIVEYTEQSQENSADTKDCYEKQNNLFQICCKSMPDDVKPDSINCNYLASLLTLNNELISGNAIFINTYIPSNFKINNKEMKNVSSLIEHILSVLMSKIIHYGVYVGHTGEVKQICFNDKKELINLDYYLSKDNITDQLLINADYSELEISLYKFNLNIYLKKDETDNSQINHNISRLIRMDTYGDIIIISCITKTIYGDLTYLDIVNMFKISHTDWDLTKSELKEEKDIDGRYIIKSKYKILHNRVSSIN